MGGGVQAALREGAPPVSPRLAGMRSDAAPAWRYGIGGTP
ncbi:Hypothetical protein ETEE_0935 [Edwardsiella anguillarum ET080813]|uniref:Uncharacterized protein n=1 Tax=Edwardsiella anguillarum ET080813 TaxID=667120 RepID=A0A076LKU8_9GAMM|nr:Hypothetical protein ETEE_0935 [Edwardsiella anguillarum ET080813]